MVNRKMKKSLITLCLAIACSSAFAETVNAPVPAGGQVAPGGAAPEVTAVTTPKTDFDLVGEVKKREPTPEEIAQIKLIWEQMRRVQEKPAGDQPRPVISMTNVDLSPGSTPPMVRLSNSTGAILMFMDMYGHKWAIDHVSNLSEADLDAQDKPADSTKEQSSVFVKAKKFGASGNLAVFLKDLDTPIIITFLAGQKDVDYRVDFRIPASREGVVSGAAEKQIFDTRLSYALMSVSPDGCTPAKTDNPEILAWNCMKDAIIRSSGILLSPATIDGKKASGADGTHAYLIPMTPVVSMMVGGKAVSVKIGGVQ